MQNSNGDYKHLKDHTYYSEIYDKFTIEKCQRWDETKYPKDISKFKGKEKKLAKIKKEYFEKVAVPLVLSIMKADYASKKSEAIQEWIKRDQAKDEKVANSKEPQGVRCLNCSSLLKNYTSCDLMDNHQGQEEALFMFECKKCGKRRAYWENGKEWEYKPTCIECKTETQSESDRKDNIITTKYSCPQCGHIEIDTLDLEEDKEEQIDPDFEANRKKYCLPEQEGYEIMIRVERMGKLVDSWKEKEGNKKLYDAVEKIKKLTVAELQSMLNPILEKAGYAKLEFDKPDFQRDVILGFGIQDIKSGRSEWDSTHELKKLLKKSLESTNWRLMSDGVQYRLGFLKSRLRGTEGEENLKGLIEKESKLINNNAEK